MRTRLSATHAEEMSAAEVTAAPRARKERREKLFIIFNLSLDLESIPGRHVTDYGFLVAPPERGMGVPYTSHQPTSA